MNAALCEQVTNGMLLWRKGTINLTANPDISMSFFILPPPHHLSELLHMWVTSQWGREVRRNTAPPGWKSGCLRSCAPKNAPNHLSLLFFYDTEKAQMGKTSPSSFLNTGSSSFQDLHSVFFTYGKQTRREPNLSLHKNSPDENPNCWHLRPCSQAGHLF